MQVFVKVVANGRILTLEVEGSDTVENFRVQIYGQEPTLHPALQRLVLDARELADGRLLRDYGVSKEAEFQVAKRPGAILVKLKVGGTLHITVLDTLLSKPGSQIHDMFEPMTQGDPPCYPAGTGAAQGAVGPDGIVEAVPCRRGAGPLPCDEDGVHHVDRNGAMFGFVLDYLRDGRVALPEKKTAIEQLSFEASYFGLGELVAVCETALAGVSSLRALVEACGRTVTVQDILALPEAKLERLLEQQQVNVVMAERVKAEIEAERERVRAEEAVRAVIRDLALSEEGVLSLIAARVTAAEVRKLDTAGARQLGLSEEDAKQFDGVSRVFVFQRINDGGNGNFDSAGVLHHIGTEGGRSAYQNPHAAGRVIVSASSVGHGGVADTVYQQPGRFRTKDEPDAWLAVDLGDSRRLAVAHYSLRSDHQGGYAPRNWELQGAGSADGPWTTLRRHANDDSLAPTEYSMADWPVEGQAAPWRHFRIFQTGVNSRGNNGGSCPRELNCGGIELYGTLVEK